MAAPVSAAPPAATADAKAEVVPAVPAVPAAAVAPAAAAAAVGTAAGAKPDVFDLIRSSTAAFVAAAKDVTIADAAAIDAFVTQHIGDAAAVRAVARPGFPLKFDSQNAEINFYCVLDVLNFGSGYRDLLHRYTRRGAFDTIAFGVMGMHLSGVRFDADALCRVTLMDVQTYFGVPIDEEFEVQRGIRSTRQHALRPLAERIRRVLVECGAVLRARQFDDFAGFIFDTPQAARIAVVSPAAADGADAKHKPMSAADVVQRLVTAFPAFADVYDPKEAEAGGAGAGAGGAGAPPASSAPAPPAADGRVYLYKKAQLLVCDLFNRFGRDDPPEPDAKPSPSAAAGASAAAATAAGAGADAKDAKSAGSKPQAKAKAKAKKELDARFAFPDIAKCTIFTDNVVPAVLRHFGVLKLSAAVAAQIDAKKPFLSSKAADARIEAELRAAAIVAADAILQRINAALPSAAPATTPAAAPVTAMELDYWLWQKGKDKAIRQLPRHYAPATVYY